MIADKNWIATLVSASIAVTLAAVGLLATRVDPGLSPLISSGILLGSLGATAFAFTLVALRVRRLELENEGLIEEVSQQFDRVKDKLEIFSEALAEPRSISPEAPVPADEPLRRVMVK